MYYTYIYLHPCRYTVLKYTLKQCFHSIFHLCQTSPHQMVHGYRPYAEKGVVKEGTSTTWSTVETQGWTGTSQRGSKHHMKHCQQPKAEQRLVKEGTSTTWSTANNSRLKREWSKREQAQREALPITQGWKGSGQRGNKHNMKHCQ